MLTIILSRQINIVQTHYKNKKNFAFTLAEVLITLGIIGVIAAIVIPIINSATQNQEIAVAVKKYQSVLQNAVNQYMTDNMSVGDLTNGIFKGAGQHQQAWDGLKKYFNLSKDCGTVADQGCFAKGVTYKLLNNTNDTIHDDLTNIAKGILLDGSSIYVYNRSSVDCDSNVSISNSGQMYNSVCAQVGIDINGAKPPNKQGRDEFTWYILKTGKVIPVGLPDCTYGGCDPTSLDVTFGADGAPGLGAGCTARVLQEGAVNY